MLPIHQFWKKWISAEKLAGYVTDQNGIRLRYLREHNHWLPHLNQCKQQILNFVAQSNAKKINILGSGWLLDVPLNDLLNTGCHVTLTDIWHPANVMHQYKTNNQVTFLKNDLTGGCVEKAVHLNHFDVIEQVISNAPTPFNISKYDAIVSVNLLNQLDILLCDYIEQKFKTKAANLAPLRQTLQQNHLNWLKGGNSLIITDVTEEQFSFDGQKIASKPLVYASFSNFKKLNHWTWVFDTHGRYNHNMVTHFNVEAWKST
jgi:hypothetical protein